MALSSYVSLTISIDWDINGAYTDESAYARRLTIERGRSDANDEMAPGSGTLVLSNSTGRFSPFNTGSALYPYVLPGRPIIITADFNAVTYPVFAGFATPTFPTRSIDSEITLNLIDQFDKWSKPPLTNTDLSTDVLNSDLMIEILDDIGFSAITRSIDTSENALAYWTNHNRLPLNGLRLLAHENLGGHVFMKSNGYFRFENAVWRSSQPLHATLSGTFDDIAPEIRFDDLVDRVRVTYPRFTVTGTLQAAYTLNPTGKALPPGLTTFAVDFAGLGVTGALSPVATTDYTANSAADGTGTDKTAQVTVSAFTADGGGATITLNNLDSSPVYLDYFQVRASIVQRGNEDVEINASTIAPLVSNVKAEYEYDFQIDGDDLQGFAEYEAERLGHLTARTVCTITPDTNALMVAVLNAEISKRVKIVDTGAAWLTQINADFFIEHIKLDFDATQQNKVTCEWLLFDDWLGEGNGFVINDDVATDWPDSVIVDDAVTVGKVIFK